MVRRTGLPPKDALPISKGGAAISLITYIGLLIPGPGKSPGINPRPPGCALSVPGQDRPLPAHVGLDGDLCADGAAESHHAVIDDAVIDLHTLPPFAQHPSLIEGIEVL